MEYERTLVENACLDVLSGLGYGEQVPYAGWATDDDNFTNTPTRMATWLLSFARIDVDAALRELLQPVFPEGHNELVIVKDIGFVALCAHHVLPYHGLAHVGYIPRKGGGVIGISKLARAVKVVAHQLTLQERITRQLADGIHETLGCAGVMVVLSDVEHACMSFRGIEDTHARTTTSAVRGVFAENDNGCKDEFLRLIAR